MGSPRSGAKTHSLFTAFPCYTRDMSYMYRALITLIRKLCVIVHQVLNGSSPSNIARLLSRVWSFILRASRGLTSKPPPPNDTGDPFHAILPPSDGASITSCIPVRSLSEVEEGLLVAVVDRISTEQPLQTDLSPRQ